MQKTEVQCDDCGTHFIVVTKGNEEVSYCPFCSVMLTDRTETESEDIA